MTRLIQALCMTVKIYFLFDVMKKFQLSDAFLIIGLGLSTYGIYYQVGTGVACIWSGVIFLYLSLKA